MRLILAVLAVANLRWARAAVDRSDWLRRRSEDAFAEGERRVALAESLIRRSEALTR